MRVSLAALAQIGRLPTPPAAALEAVSSEVKVRDFFREICRFVPWAVKNYRLEDMTTPAELRSNVAALFKARPPVADPRVVDILIYKGREELESIVLQHKQRHHLVGEYVLGPRALNKAAKMAADGVAGGRSAFLDAFYKNTA